MKAVVALLFTAACTAPSDQDAEGNDSTEESASAPSSTSSGTPTGPATAGSGSADTTDASETNDPTETGDATGTSTGPSDHPTNPDLVDLEPNTWFLLSSGGIEFAGHHAYSGGDYDPVHHQFLVFGGGHFDGWHNDILAFDIATATWSTLTETDPETDYTCDNVDEAQPGMLLASMRPASRHTYDQIEFIDHAARLLVWSGPTYSGIWDCPGQTLPADTWLFDPAAAAWTYGNASAQPQPAGEAHCGGYDPIGRLYYAMRQGELWSYDVDDDSWTLLAPNGTPTSSSYTRVITVDPGRQQLWMRPDVYDVASNAWSTSEAADAPPIGLSEAFDTANDVLVVHSGLEVFGYSPADDTWEVRDPANPIADPASSGQGPYGRFFYDPVDGVVLFITVVDYVVEVWAYRWA